MGNPTLFTASPMKELSKVTRLDQSCKINSSFRAITTKLTIYIGTREWMGSKILERTCVHVLEAPFPPLVMAARVQRPRLLSRLSRGRRCVAQEGKKGESSSATRRIISLLWPLGALWLASRPLPVQGEGAKWSKDDFSQRVDPAAYKVLAEGKTERPFSSPLNKEARDGVFACKACGNSLYDSKAKFDSGTGWPSFFEPVAGGVNYSVQPLYLLNGPGTREVHCARCGGHLGAAESSFFLSFAFSLSPCSCLPSLIHFSPFSSSPGHVFDDGPAPTGKRHCINVRPIRCFLFLLGRG